VQPGDLYAALPGARTHGAEYAAAAASLGAVAALTDPAGAPQCRHAGLSTYVVPDPRAVLGRLAAWVYGEPARSLLTVGVTGTNGKTTTAHLLEAGLRAAGRVPGLLGTIEARVAGRRLPSERTTPEAPDLQALLAVMVEQGADAVAMEVSSHALALGRVDGMTYDIAVFTNLSEDHLDFHHDMADYFAAKASLFTPERSRHGVIDVDDDYGRLLAAQASVPVTTVSPSGGDADWRVEDMELAADCSRFSLAGPGGRVVSCSTRLVGMVNLVDAALAVVALAAAGLDAQQAADGVAACPGVPGRMEPVGPGRPDAPVALVDFAHSPDAVERLLATTRELVEPGGRLVLVIGAGGDRDPFKRPVMGRIAARDADIVVLTSDNPRSENPITILEALAAGAAEVPDAQVEVVADRRAAIERAVRLAGPRDVVVVAGKGHEPGQEVAGVVHPFDDRVVLAECLGMVDR
jgi:UDP-N-acetylmuramoyl-L-alanyl-D-glutamate--2,6-diaminopimelate ligase